MKAVVDEILSLENELEKFGLQWVEYDSKRKIMEDTEKSVLAKLMAEHLGDPVNMREMKARMDKRFLAHLEGLAEARHQSSKSKFLMDLVKEKLQNRRNINSLAREEMRLQ